MSNEPKESAASQPMLDALITLEEAAELSGLTSRHLRNLAHKGYIWAKKLGRNWFTTEQAVRDYLARERRPGPKPQKSS